MVGVVALGTLMIMSDQIFVPNMWMPDSLAVLSLPPTA